MTLPPLKGPGGGFLDFRVLAGGAVIFVASNGHISALPAGADEATWLSEQTYAPAPGQIAFRVAPDGFKVAAGDFSQTPGTLLNCRAVTSCRRVELPAATAALAISPGGERILVSMPCWLDPLRLLSAESGKVLDYPRHTRAPQSMSWAEDGSNSLRDRNGLDILRGQEATSDPRCP